MRLNPLGFVPGIMLYLMWGWFTQEVFKVSYSSLNWGGLVCSMVGMLGVGWFIVRPKGDPDGR